MKPMELQPYRRGHLFSGLTDLHRQLNRLFEDFSIDWPRGGEREWAPLADIAETENAIQVRVEIPGVEEKDLEISVAGNVLTIRGNKHVEEEKKGKTWWSRETLDGTFSRTLQLPTDIDADHIEAMHHAGVLEVRLPKKAAAAARKIKIKSA
jgi:HSP20 family protein